MIERTPIRTSALLTPLLALAVLLSSTPSAISQLEIATLEDEQAYDDIQWNEYEAFRDVHSDTDVAWELLLAALEPGTDGDPLQRPEEGWLLVDDTWIMAEELPYRSSLWSRVRVRVGGMTTTDQWSRAESLLNSVAALLDERLAYETWLLEQEQGAGSSYEPASWAGSDSAVYIIGGGSYWWPYYGSNYGSYRCSYPYYLFPYYSSCFGSPYWWSGCDYGCSTSCKHGWNDDGNHYGGGDDKGPKTDPDPGGGGPDLTPTPRTVRMTDLARRVADIRSARRGGDTQGSPGSPTTPVIRSGPVSRGAPGTRSGGTTRPGPSVPGVIVMRPSSQPRTLSTLRRSQPTSPIQTRVVRTSSRSRLTLPTQRRTSSSSRGLSLTSRLGSGTSSRRTSGVTRSSSVRTSSSGVRSSRSAGRSRSGSSRQTGSSRGSSRGSGRGSGRAASRGVGGR